MFSSRKEQRFVKKKNGKRVAESLTKSGTGFLVADENPVRLFLVTAQHVATDMKTQRTITLRGDNDTPINMPLEDLVGQQNVRWVFHDREDVAVVILHPAAKIVSSLQGHFMRMSMLVPDESAPSRDRPLTTLGFPLGIGTQERFSPISRDSKPASGLLTLLRPDKHTAAVYFLLDNPSIGGFSGAPLFLFPNPYTSGGSMIFPESGGGAKCVGLINGTISDDTGGKMAAVTPSIYILETIKKAIAAVTN